MSLRKVLTSKVTAFFIILPFIKPASELTGRFDILFDIWKVFSIFLILIEYIKFTQKRERITTAIFLLQIVFLVSTILHLGDIKTALVDAGSNIALCCYMEYLIKKEGLKCAARNFALPCVVFAIVTALTMYIFFPGGMYTVEGAKENYLWGFDNSSAFRFVPAMYFMSLYSVKKNVKKVHVFSFLFLAFCTSAFIYVRSLTAGFLMIVFTFSFLVFVINDGKLKIINTRNIVLLVLVLSIILIVYKNDLSRLMEFAAKNDKFGSLSLRFNVWRRSIEQWKQNPILGLGIEYTTETLDKLILDHPHNVFLDVLYHGGIVAFGCLLYVLEKLMAVKQRKNKINIITAFALLSILVIAQMDFYNAQYLFYPMLLLSYYATKEKEASIIKYKVRYGD